MKNARVKSGVFFIGMLFLVVGVALLGNNLDLWDVDIFFDGFWTLFLIIPGLYGIIVGGARTWNLILVGLGVYFLLYTNDVVPNILSFGVIFAVVVIIVGVNIIISAFRTKREKNYEQYQQEPQNFTNQSGTPPFNAPFGDSNNRPEYVSVFSATTNKSFSPNLMGGTATAVFGGLTVDLSGVDLNHDISFECTAIFGKVKLIAPSNADVRTEVVPIFGGFNCNRMSSPGANLSVFTIKGASVFAEIEII